MLISAVTCLKEGLNPLFVADALSWAISYSLKKVAKWSANAYDVTITGKSKLFHCIR